MSSADASAPKEGSPPQDEQAARPAEADAPADPPASEAAAPAQEEASAPVAASTPPAPAADPLASNPLRPSEEEAPTEGPKHVKFRSGPPAVAEVAFVPSPTHRHKSAGRRLAKLRGKSDDAQPASGERALAVQDAAIDGEAAKDDPNDADAAADGDAPKAEEDAENEASRAETASASSETSSDEIDSDLDPCERLFLEGQRQTRRRMRLQRRVARAKEAAETAEIEKHGFKPELSESAKQRKKIMPFSWQRFWEGQDEFRHKVARKNDQKTMEEMKRVREKEDMPMVTGKDGKKRPLKVNVSEELIKSMQAEGRYNGPVKGWRRRYADFVVKRSGQAADGASFSRHHRAAAPGDEAGSRSPSASQQSAREKEEESHVFERLYQHAETRRAAQELMVAAHVEAEGGSLFQPLTNHRVSRIHAQAQASLQRERALGHNVSSASGGASAHRERQQLLLRAMGADVPAENADEEDDGEAAFGTWQETSYPEGDNEDASAPGGVRYADPAAYDSGNDDIVVDLDPFVLAGDPSPPRQPEEVVDSLLEKGEEYKTRAEQRREAAARRKMDECTFKPHTNPKSKEILQRVAERVNDGSYSGRQHTVDVEGDEEFESAMRSAVPPYHLRRSEADVVRAAGGGRTTPRTGASTPSATRSRFDVDQFTSRSQRKLAEKQEKIERMRAQRRAEADDECTFRPTLAKASREAPVREPKLATSLHFTPAASRTANDSFSPKPRTPAGVASKSAAARPGAKPHIAAPRTTKPAQQRQSPRQAATPATLRGVSDVRRRSPAGSVTSSAGPGRGAGRASPLSTPRAGAKSAGSSAALLDDDVTGLDDGMAYLEALEKELQGVLDEWRTV